MKKLFKVSIIMLIVLLTGCSQNSEQYESKDISVTSAFDGFDYENSDSKNLKTAFDSEDKVDVSEKKRCHRRR